MNKLIFLLTIITAGSVHADYINLDLYPNSYCHADVGFENGELQFTVLHPGLGNAKSVEVAVPIGANGSYIAQAYYMVSSFISRAGYLLTSYKKMPFADGSLGEHYEEFPEYVTTSKGSWDEDFVPKEDDPTTIGFKGMSGLLICEK